MVIKYFNDELGASKYRLPQASARVGCFDGGFELFKEFGNDSAKYRNQFSYNFQLALRYMINLNWGVASDGGIGPENYFTVMPRAVVVKLFFTLIDL